MTKARTNGDNIGRTLISTTSLVGLSTLNLSVPSGYKNLYVDIYGIYTATDGDYTNLRFNNDSASNYRSVGLATGSNILSATSLQVARTSSTPSHASFQRQIIEIEDHASSISPKTISNVGLSMILSTATNPNLSAVQSQQCFWINSAVITSLYFYTTTGLWNAGTINLYGVK